MIINKRGMVFSLLGMLIAAIIVVFLFLKAANVYFKKNPESDKGPQNVLSENGASPSLVTRGDAESVLSSVESQINAATQKETARANELQNYQ